MPNRRRRKTLQERLLRARMKRPNFAPEGTNREGAMGVQRTAAELAWNARDKVTRQERFSADMDAVMSRAALVMLIDGGPRLRAATRSRRP
jgi:hypothetical protein